MQAMPHPCEKDLDDREHVSESPLGATDSEGTERGPEAVPDGEQLANDEVALEVAPVDVGLAGL